jgi:predicted component of type VI protein secretion system
MKLSLVVQSEGKASGKTIPITLSQFIIGRDPQCQLRPASAVISKRHCAVISRGGKFFIRDFDSTNGTFVNDEAVKGERELTQDDILKVGPLTFCVMIEGIAPVNKPTPLPKKLNKPDSDDESVAAMLLDIADEGSAAKSKDADGVPEGTTAMDLPSPYDQPPAEDGKEPEAAKSAAKAPDKKKESGNTSAAAKAILDKYTRRTRS